MGQIVLRKGDVIKTIHGSGGGKYVVKFIPPFVVPKTGVYLVDYEAGTIESAEDLGEDE